jgi:hypothetical protein
MILNSTTNANLFNSKMNSPINVKFTSKINLRTLIADKKGKKTIEPNKTTLNFDRKCDLLKHNYKGPFSEVPESFPGITLLNFGIKKNKTLTKKIRFFNKKSPSKEEIKANNKKSYKEQVMSKIKQTVRDNILRNARRVAYPMYPNYY